MPFPFDAAYDPLNPDVLGQIYAPAPQVPVPTPQEDVGPVTTPETLISPQTTPAAPNQVSSGQSVSAGKTGTNFGTLNQLDQRGKRGVDRELAQSKAGIQAQQAATSQGYVDASQLEKQSIVDKTNTTTLRKDYESEANFALQRMEDDYMAKEQEVRAAEQVTHQQYMTEYNRQRQEIMATQINPAKLFADMTGGEQSGVLLTAFIHDFLGTRGIKTSAMDTYSKAVERSVDAQIANLNNKKAGLDSFRQMWDMQRAQSKSDEEARTRIHGIALESFKAGVQAKLAEFDSEYARAELPALIAGVDKALLGNLTQLDTIARDNIRKEADIILTKERDKLHAANEAARIAIARRQLKLEEDRAKRGPSILDINKQIVRAEGGKVLGQARSENEAADLQTRINGLEKLNRNLPRMQELQRKLGGTYQGPGATLLTDKDKRELESLYNETISDIVFAKSGKAATDTEREALKKQIPLDTFTSGILGGGDVGEYVASQFNLRQITDEVSGLQNQLIPTSPEVAQALAGGLNFNPYEAEKEQQKIIAEGRDKPGESSVDKAVGKVYSDVSNELVAPANKTTKEEAREFFKDYVGSRDYTTKSAEYGLEDNVGEQVTARTPTWFQGLSDLSFIARNKSLYSDAERQEAIDKLGEIAHDPNDESEQKYAAKYFLYKIASENK